MSKTAFRYDRGELRKPERTPQGFLRVDALFGRAGIYEYRNDDGSIRRELRPPEEVQSPEALASFADASVTLGHPRRADGQLDEVTAENVRRHEVGTVSGAARADGDDAAGTVVVKDKAAIKKIEGGLREVSPGYKIELDETPGTHPKYGRYDAIQRRIRVNHLAIVDRARGGSTCRLRMDEAERWDAELSAKERHALPAADFAVPEDEGLPISDAVHVRAAMARFDQYKFLNSAQRKSAYRKILAAAKRLDIDASNFADEHRADSQSQMTTAVDGHQHLLSCHDWNGCEVTAGDTSYSVSQGATNGHTHPWVKDAFGVITIGESEGHTHSLLVEDGSGYGSSAMAPGQRLDSGFDRSAPRHEPVSTMTTQANAPAPDAAEQVRLLTIRADEADRAQSEQRTRADAAEREAQGLRAELATAKERITTLTAQISAGASAVETAAVLEQRTRADAAERELSQLKQRFPVDVKARAGLVAKAQAVLGASFRADSLTDREILVQGIRHLVPKEPTGPEVSEDYLRRRFDALIEDRATYGASLARASQIMRQDTQPSGRAPQSRSDRELPWADRWKGGLGEFSTSNGKGS